MTKSNTRQRLVESALRRFYRDGFRSVGIDQILTDVGISKTAFYKHFESKENLMLAALEYQNGWLQKTFLTLMQEHGGPSPIGQLHALLDVVEYIVESNDYHGCMFVNVAMEFPLPHEPAHIAAAQNKQAVEDMVCSVAAEAGAVDPRSLAKELCLLMEGAYVTRHVTGNKQTVDVARRVASLIIAAGCPQNSAPCATGSTLIE
jgi:AcrR family transcriptional regulator